MNKLEVLLSEEQIQQKVSELGAAISDFYGQKTLHLVGLLDNGFMFMSDLARKLTCPTVCQFVKLEQHDVVEDGHERRLIVYTPHLEVRGQHLLLVDSILQTGITLDHLIEQFRIQGAASLKTAVLIDRVDQRRVALEPDFSGFQARDKFLVGYGMGYRDLYRNLPYVAELADVTMGESRALSTAAEGKD